MKKNSKKLTTKVSKMMCGGKVKKMAKGGKVVRVCGM